MQSATGGWYVSKCTHGCAQPGMPCSDGSLPDEANCGTDGCKSLDAQCPNGTVFWQLSRVDVPVGKGVGELCLNAAVGIRIGSGTVAQIGVDAAVLGGVALASVVCCASPLLQQLLPLLGYYSYCMQQSTCVFCDQAFQPGY